jgi:hypothetical protein
MKIHVHIERLILDGLPVDRRSAPQVELALQQELASLLATAPLPAGALAGAAMPRLKAASITVAEGTPARTIGAAIAKSLHGGLAP